MPHLALTGTVLCTVVYIRCRMHISYLFSLKHVVPGRWLEQAGPAPDFHCGGYDTSVLTALHRELHSDTRYQPNTAVLQRWEQRN